MAGGVKPKMCLQAGEWLDVRAGEETMCQASQAEGQAMFQEETSDGDKDAGLKEAHPEQKSPQRHLPRCYNCRNTAKNA